MQPSPDMGALHGLRHRHRFLLQSHSRRSSTSSTCISFRSRSWWMARSITVTSRGRRPTLSKFYTMMREGKVITTSLPNLKDSASC
ncbi:MAG: hypothetical protein ACLTDR_00800 [Adlercreutzia equolifaciens]